MRTIVIHNNEIYFNSILLGEVVRTVTAFDVDTISRHQLESKLWAARTLKALQLVSLDKLGTVFLHGDMYGILNPILFEVDLDIDKVRGFVMDSTAEKIAEAINREYVSNRWKFKAVVVQDMHDIDYEGFAYQVKKIPLYEEPDTIIHMSYDEPWELWYQNIPEGKLVVLQGEEEIMVPMTQTLFHDKLLMPTQNRFMKIGYV